MADNRENSKQKQGGMGLNVGSASVIMLFAVLALTVLAALSLLSANAQLRLAVRTGEATASYYAADTKASEIFYAVRNNDTPKLQALTAQPDVHYSRQDSGEHTIEVAVSDELALQVLLESSGSGEDDGAPPVVREVSRRLIIIGEWTPDESMDIWDSWT